MRFYWGLPLLGLAAVSYGQGYRASGMLVSAVDGLPVRHGRATFSIFQSGRQAREAVDADNRGRFTAILPTAGVWRLEATAPGFVSQAYRQHGQLSTAVVVGAGKPMPDLYFVLSPQTEISGHVSDEAEESIRGAHVTLLPFPSGTPARTAFTDDRGEYVLGDILPGRYRLVVKAAPWYAVAAGSATNDGDSSHTLAPDLDVAYPLTWFPGVVDPTRAEYLEMKPGEKKNLDFHLSPVPSVHLRIMPADAGRLLGKASIVPQVRLAGMPWAEPLQVSHQRTEQGEIDIGGLPPGMYDVALLGVGQGGKSSTWKIADGVAQAVSVAEGPRFRRANGRMGASYARILPEASLAVDGVARQGESPAAGATVLLLPLTIGEPGAIDVLRADQSATDGSFHLQQVLPGRYILVAIENGWSIDWSDVATMQRYLLQGVPLDLGTSTPVSQDVVVQR